MGGGIKRDLTGMNQICLLKWRFRNSNTSEVVWWTYYVGFTFWFIFCNLLKGLTWVKFRKLSASSPNYTHCPSSIGSISKLYTHFIYDNSSQSLGKTVPGGVFLTLLVPYLFFKQMVKTFLIPVKTLPDSAWIFGFTVVLQWWKFTLKFLTEVLACAFQANVQRKEWQLQNSALGRSWSWTGMAMHASLFNVAATSTTAVFPTDQYWGQQSLELLLFLCLKQTCMYHRKHTAWWTKERKKN